jgi:RimJ/RimL family protein N-acetyltransferase
MEVGQFFAPNRLDAGEFVIRSYQPGDGKALRAAVDESYLHLRAWMPWAAPESTDEDYEARCRRFCGNYLLNQDFVLGIWIGDEVVGGTGFHLRQGALELRNAEIGMWIRQSHAGKGFGTRVLKAMLKWGFTEWGWERLVWRCDPKNLASKRVAEKCGFILEGTSRSDSYGVLGERRDMHVFAILRSEWENG